MAHLLPSHLHKTKVSQPEDGGLSFIGLHGLMEGGEDFFLVLPLVHVDEINDDDAPDIAEAQLPGNLTRCLEIGLQYRVRESGRADELTCVDIN